MQTKRTAALSLHIQAQKSADVPGLIAHHFRRGRFYGFEELVRKGANDAQAIMELHIEHPVIHYYHSSAVYKSFPRMLFLLLETAALIQTIPDAEICVETVDHPDILTLAESAQSVAEELVVVLNLQDRLRSSDGPGSPDRRRRYCFERAVGILRTAGMPITPNLKTAFVTYDKSRHRWERSLFVVANFLGYDWTGLTGNAGLEVAVENDSAEVAANGESST